MAFNRPLTIEQWGREMSSRMEAKSHLLHAPMRQSVTTSPKLVAKRRRAEERKLLAELTGAAEIMMPFDAMIDALRRGWLTDDSVGSMGSYLGRMQRYLCASYALAKSAGSAQMLERAKAGLTALCQAIQRRIDAGQMDKPVIVTGDELRAIQSTANMLAAALPHASCGAWALAAESAADSERKILILMGRGLHAS